MAIKIRLKRMGNRNRPFYRLVVQDSRWRRDGKTIEDIGWYDPVKQPVEKSFKEQRIYSWLEKGVQLTETVRSLLKNEGILEKFRTGSYKNQESTDSPVTSAAEPAVKPVPETAKKESQPSAEMEVSTEAES
ncbi:MAG: 30S ribosomal protein S16 [Candidatus Omnitrophota bacterium]|jgi:small subunit ribosomal protein S16|nr:MAG: 30S ribosomal protein S16 [Candidatus Omnitrophota bacterium]